MRKRWLISTLSLVCAAGIILAGSYGLTYARFSDHETSTGNAFTAWTSSLWTQTSQADFNAGVLINTENTTAGDVQLPLLENTSSATGDFGSWTDGPNGYLSDNQYAISYPLNPTVTNSPTTNNGTAWTNPDYAYASDSNNATISIAGASGNNTWENYGFSLTGKTITDVRVRYDAYVSGTSATSDTRVPTSDGDRTGTWDLAQYRLPNANGTSSGTWTASTGTLWECVNDHEAQGTGGDADYITSPTTAGSYQLFTFPAFTIPPGSTIKSVILQQRSADVTLGTNSVQCAIRVGGTNYYCGTQHNPGTTFAHYNKAWTMNPKTTSAWTVDEVNGIGANALQEMGIYSTDWNPAMKTSAIFLEITYTHTGYTYMEVDETTPTLDDTNYLEALSGTTLYQLYNFTNFSVPGGSTITNLTIFYRAMDTDDQTNGGNNIRGAIKVNGTRYYGPGNDPGVNFATYGYVFSTNPATGTAWTVDQINNVGGTGLQQFGVQSSDVSPDIYVSMIYVQVNYTTTSASAQIRIDVSWDGGTTWSARQEQNLTSTKTTYWYDVSAVTAWDSTKLNNTNLKVRANAYIVGSGVTVRLDWLPVEVTYFETSNISQTYTDYGISLTGNLISKVEVGFEAFAVSSEKIAIDVSWDDGLNWSSIQTSDALGSSDPNTITWFNFTSARTPWTPAELDNDHLQVRIWYVSNGFFGQVSMDYLPVRITYRPSSGSIASQVLNTNGAGATWDALVWDKTLPANTNITVEVRSSNTIFTKDAVTPSWTSVGASPVVSGLPTGQYKQWRATLTTTNVANTPVLHEVRVWYDP